MVIFLWKCVKKLNSINDAGTPLNIAIREERWDIVKFLIHNGADVNLTDIYGNFSVELCTQKLNSEIMQEHL
jgi:ankyrin repeat protein